MEPGDKPASEAPFQPKVLHKPVQSGLARFGFGKKLDSGQLQAQKDRLEARGDKEIADIRRVAAEKKAAEDAIVKRAPGRPRKDRNLVPLDFTAIQLATMARDEPASLLAKMDKQLLTTGKQPRKRK
jgi:hypothetical protein